MSREAIKAIIDTTVTNKVAENSIPPTVLGSTMKEVVDLTLDEAKVEEQGVLDAAIAAKDETIEAKNEAVTAKNTTETLKGEVETLRDEAVTAKTLAETGATTATNKATEAGDSEAIATNKADEATISANTATTKAGEAEQYAIDAETAAATINNKIDFTFNDTPKRLYNDYVNLIPDNLMSSGIDYWTAVPINGTNNMTLSIQPFDNPFTKNSLRAVANAASASANWFGIYHDVTQVLSPGDTLVFKGLIYPTTSGVYLERRFRNAGGTTLQTLSNINLVANEWNEIEFEAVLPANTVFANFFVRNIAQTQVAYLTAWDVHKKLDILISPKITIPAPVAVNEGILTIYVATTGNDSNSGKLVTTPVLTINRAIELLQNIPNGRIVIAEGIYRETLDFSNLFANQLSIVGRIDQTVRILGSDQITGWALTAGKTNVYQKSFSGTINATKPVIFEDGRPSLNILESERNALQKSTTHRLPYSKLTAIAFNSNLATTLNDLEATPGRYYYDTIADILYIHASDSDNPASNGYSYEYAVRDGCIRPPLNSNTSILNLTNLTFQYSNAIGLDLQELSECHRMWVTVMGSALNGIEDSSTFTISYNDEVADCKDGVAGTTSRTDNNRERCSHFYFNAWFHDNADDGASHHSKSSVVTWGCLSEYNGKSGLAPSNSSQWTDYNSVVRRNGSPAHSTFGEGIEVINVILSPDPGIGVTFTGHGTISENNRVGFAVKLASTTQMTLYNCVSRNNSHAEYEANMGVIHANNCKVTNSDPLKLKVTSSGGVINVINDTDLT